jgi:1,4-dihydroxy-2-naphthoate octaprenyltransferase
MNFLANFWWLFLILAVVCMMIALLNQIGRMKRISNLTAFGDARSGFLQGLVPFVLAGLGASVFGLLAIVGIIVAIVRHFSA